MTGLNRQAKTLSDVQLRTLLHFVATETAFPDRNRVIVLLSFKAGLRAKEIACIRWGMVTDAEGMLLDALSLVNRASKGRSGRVMPLHPELTEALALLHEREQSKRRGGPADFIVSFTKVRPTR